MNLSVDILERLTFVKYLHKQAGEQKLLSRPLSSSAILTMHDCIECFLQVCYEVKTGKSKISSKNILDTYAEELNKIFAKEKQQTINKSFIKRINDLRNQLKHATIFTDSKQVPNLFIETEIFLKDFTEQVFKIEFVELSLIQLIKNGCIKNHLKDANEYIIKNELQRAMWSIGKAFYELESRMNQLQSKYSNLLSKPHNVDYLIKHSADHGGKNIDYNLSRNLIEIANDINRLDEDIYNLRTALSLSVDLKKFLYFKHIMPHVTKLYRGTEEPKFWIPDEEQLNIVQYELEVVKKCYNFTVELALKNE